MVPHHIQPLLPDLPARFGIVPDTVYMVHINTLPETKYTWHDWVKRVHPPAPVRVVQPFPPSLRPGSKPTRIDLHYKVR